MTTTITPNSTLTVETEAKAPSLRRTTVVVGLAAAAAVTVVAAGLHAAGVSFEIEGEMIPLLGFAQMTFIGAVLGGVILAVLNRRSADPHRRFLQVTAVLTALSCLPDLTMPDSASTKVALVATHLIAAAIVVPALRRHAR